VFERVRAGEGRASAREDGRPSQESHRDVDDHFTAEVRRRSNDRPTRRCRMRWPCGTRAPNGLAAARGGPQDGDLWASE